jgi:hypothetical protein
VYGDFELLLPEHERFYAYRRTFGGEAVLVVLNWSGESATFEPESPLANEPSGILHANYEHSPTSREGADFRPYEAVVIGVESPVPAIEGHLSAYSSRRKRPSSGKVSDSPASAS